MYSTDGTPVAEAMVAYNDSNKVLTNERGEFTVNVADGTLMTIAAEGFLTKRVVSSQTIRTIYLVKSEMVNVALKTIKSQDVISGVSYLNVSELIDKNYYTTALDNLQSLAAGFNGNIWGNSSYLVVVDGVPRDASNVLPSESEQITVLKGVGAVALYGSHAARGVVVITTKRGLKMKDQIKVRANSGIHVPKLYPSYLGSAEYMELYNEARSNDGLTPLYDAATPEYDIENYRTVKNPYRFPDINYYSSEYLRKVYNRSDVITEFIGGNDRARYYANIGFNHNNSLLNVGEGKNDATSRINIRGNIDFKINSFISSKVNATMVFYDQKGAQGNYWSNASTLRPNQYTPLIPVGLLKGQLDGDQELMDAILKNSSFLIDGKYLLGGNNSQQTNPFAEMYTKGSSTYTSNNFQFDVSVDANLNALLDGLSFNTQFGIDYLSSYNLSVNNNTYAVYEPQWWTGSDGNDSIYALIRQTNVDKLSRGRSLSNSYLRQNTFFNAGFNYNNTFGEGHNVSAILNVRGNMSSVSELYQKNVSANFGFQTSYNYMQKYYADFTGNMVYSSRFAPGSARKAISPTMSLAWRLSNENFLNNSEHIDDLQMTLSTGIINTDLDFTEYYLYSEIYQRTGSNSWQEDMARNPTYITRGGNADLTFVKRKEINAGLSGAFFSNKLRLSASYFYSVMDGMPIQNANLYPGFFTYSSTNMLPYDNYNADLRTGVDFNVNYSARVGNIDLSVGLNGMYFDTKALKRSENYEFENQKREGGPINGIYGMRALGFYASETEISERAVTHALGAVKPGDIKYKDITGDDIIDGKDIELLGRWTPPLFLGLNFTAKWNDFTLFAIVSGNFGGYGLKNNSYNWVYGDRKYSEVVRGRSILGNDANTGEIIVTNSETATYPRLTTLSSDNNFRDSDFWLYKTDRLSLNRVQLSYNLPKQLFQNTVLSGVGVYLSGSDLLVISKEKKHMEMNVGSSPQTRFYNLGVKVAF